MAHSRTGAVAVVVASLLLAGCGSNNTAATSTSPSPTPASSPTPAPTPTQSPRTLVFKLNACTDPATCGVPSKFGNGTARVDIKVSGYTLTVIVKGLTPKTSHLINFHSGSCAVPDLTQWRQSEVVKADAKGTLTSVSTWPGVYSIPTEGQILTVHGDDPTRRQTHIACVGMTN